MSTKEKIKQFEINRYESLYKFFGLPFGAKQKQIYDNSFEINYSRPKHSLEILLSISS